MKVFCIFFVLLFLGILNISCSSGKKEIRSDQTEAKRTQVSAASQEKIAVNDTLSSTALSYFSSNIKDTTAGILYVTGNEPFTKLALYISTDTVFRVEADSSLKSRLWQLQGKRVCIVGVKKTAPTGPIINVSSFYIVP